MVEELEQSTIFIQDDEVFLKSTIYSGNSDGDDVDEVFKDWDSCMDYSIRACLSHWRCSVKCALDIPKVCFGAIALACYYAPK